MGAPIDSWVHEGRLTRRQLLKSAAVGGGALLAAPYVGSARAAEGGGRAALSGMNVILFLTDQDRAIQHFPKGWANTHLPGLTRLRRNGLTFNRAFTNSCMCSPARSTLMSGYFPAQHGVKYTLETDMPASKYPQVELPFDLKNMASVASAVGYTPVYKGKWHLSKPAGSQFAPEDVGKYGFGRWNPPDGGANQDVSEAGGGTTNHDGRYMNSVGSATAGQEGALEYLTSQAAQDQPFFLVVSLVNPHDVLLYPTAYKAAGYDDSWLGGEILLPETLNENLLTKPTAQRLFLQLFNFASALPTPEMQLAYVNFYANLMRASDAYLVKVLDTLRHTGLLDNTLIVRTADHGEMGLAHGGLRQKNFNVYEESIRVPLVYSNPRLFPNPRRSDALVSHVDFLPTIASLLGAPKSARARWQGVDYSKGILNPSATAAQDYVVFTYDDFQSGQARGPYIPPPNRIVALREMRWKIAKYYDASGAVPSEWEFYDLTNDPFEQNNLARPGYARYGEQQREFTRLQGKLAQVESIRLAPLR
jgi:arylsulfatase A-like enzyme